FGGSLAKSSGEPDDGQGCAVQCLLDLAQPGSLYPGCVSFARLAVFCLQTSQFRVSAAPIANGGPLDKDWILIPASQVMPQPVPEAREVQFADIAGPLPEQVPQHPSTPEYLCPTAHALPPPPARRRTRKRFCPPSSTRPPVILQRRNEE